MKNYAGIKINGVKKDVHRLVAEAKIGRVIESDEVVHHIDGDKRNNSPENLEVMKRSKHSRYHMRQESKKLETLLRLRANGEKAKKGSANCLSKLIEKDIPKIRKSRESGASYQEIATAFGVSKSTVRSILSGKTWRHC